MFFRLLLLFIVIPAVELILLIKIGTKIGLFPTLAIIIFTGFLGAFLTKLQGALALNKFRIAMMQGRLPKDEVLDGVMILLAGAVLLTPGFLTDIAGFSLLIPAFRKPIGRWIGKWLKNNIKFSVVTSTPAGTPGQSQRRSSQGDVIEADAEVIEKESDELP